LPALGEGHRCDLLPNLCQAALQAAAALPGPPSRDQVELHALNKYHLRRLSRTDRKEIVLLVARNFGVRVYLIPKNKREL
jgi:hypothetical protein